MSPNSLAWDEPGPPGPWVYPYVEDPHSSGIYDDGDVVLRPVLEVELLGPGLDPDDDPPRVAALVDSGAERTSDSSPRGNRPGDSSSDSEGSLTASRSRSIGMTRHLPSKTSPSLSSGSSPEVR